MLKSSARSMIRLRGVRHNNLKNFDLDLPLHQLIVITGLSGSGKSSLAFDTLFAEGQRRYIETFSPYARQFFDRMDKPQVDSIEGIPPAIAIEQRNAVRTTRSTVGTMTEICDYMKMLWPHIAQLNCRQCAQPVRKDSPQQIWEVVKCGATTAGANANPEVLVTFDLPLSDKLSLAESLTIISKQGYQRLLLNGRIVRLDEAASALTRPPIPSLTVVQDRLKPTEANRARFVEACEQAYHFGKGELAIRPVIPAGSNSQLPTINSQPFSNRLHCAQCDLSYRDPSPALFSFNHPVGACPACRGFGRAISIDYNLALPDRSKTLAQGVVKPWQTGKGAECQTDLLRMCRHFEIPTNVPFHKLAKKWQDFVIEGEPDYGKDEEHEWPRAWYGIKGYFRWLESKAYKMHVRVLLSRYRAYTPCPDCRGQRFQPETLLYRVAADVRRLTSNSETSSPSSTARNETWTLSDFYQLPIRDALQFIESLSAKHQARAHDPLALVLNEVRSRLGYLSEVGLGYLTLDRPTRSLSGGETERVNLTTCLGTRLVNTLFVLDEPSVGLHPRDTARLVRILQQLRDTGNTVVVVEHEASVMCAADQIVDLGPGHGATGGQVMFQGTYKQILGSKQSLTGQYLSGRKHIEIPQRRPVGSGWEQRVSYENKHMTNNAFVLNDAPSQLLDALPICPALRITNANRHNLRNLSVEIPLGRFVCITGVSGSGKTTLAREVLLPALAAKFQSGLIETKASDRFSTDQNGEDEKGDSAIRIPQSALLEGWEHLGRVVLVDQSILGKTPRSNPGVYIGAFDDIRELFAQSEEAKQRGLNASAFSFNSSQGQCERCRGAGFEKIEMQFLSDVFIRCPDCQGRRYRAHILEVKIGPKAKTKSQRSVAKGQKAALRTHSTETRSHGTRNTQYATARLSIADLLDATIEEVVTFLSAFPDSRPARRAVESLNLLQEVGLGYLKLGQPINTLSGGESQRLKLVRHLAAVLAEQSPPSSANHKNSDAPSRTSPLTHSQAYPLPGHRLSDGYINDPTSIKPTLFLFDEPTTGLHFDDVRVLLKVFQRLVDAGHSVLVIEHNLDVIRSADWIIDLGPDAGDQGGQLVIAGTPEGVAACEESHTGKALRDVLTAQESVLC